MISVQVFIAMTGAFMTFTLAMLAGVWHFASIATGIKTDAKLLREELSDFKLKAAAVEKIPDHERRLGVLEGVSVALSSEVSGLKLSHALMHRDMQSINPPKPRQASHHDGGQ